jgi:hypothetical protein
MELTSRETWTLIHGLILGSLFLLAFAGGLAGLYSFRSELVTPEGIKERLLRLQIGVTGMAVLAWATVITGTWIVYLVPRDDRRQVTRRLRRSPGTQRQVLAERVPALEYLG